MSVLHRIAHVSTATYVKQRQTRPRRRLQQHVIMRRLRVEPLEPRCLLAAAPIAQTIPYLEGFESGDVAALDGWEFVIGPDELAPPGAFTVTNEHNPHGGNYHLDSSPTGLAYAFHGAALLLDLADQQGATDLTLDFWIKRLAEPRSLFILTVSGDKPDYPASEVVDVFFLDSVESLSYMHKIYDLDDAITRHNLDFDNSVYVGFWVENNASPGVFIDNVRVTNAPVFGQLSLAAADAVLAERNGTTSTVVTVSRPSELTVPLEVTLVSSDPEQLYVPRKITIPAGETSTQFEVTAVNDGMVDGTARVLITASAVGADDGSAAVDVADDDTPELKTLGGQHLNGALPAGDYSVVSNVVVDGGSTLTIDPGARLFFEPNTGMTIVGSLRAEATAQSPILFTSAAADPVPGDWLGLSIYEAYEAGDSVLDHAHIAFATTGLTVSAKSVTVDVANSDIHHNQMDGILLFDTADVVVRSSKIHDNGENGIRLFASAEGCFLHQTTSANIASNIIADNAAAGIRLAAHGRSKCLLGKTGFVEGVIIANTILRNQQGIHGFAESLGNGARINTQIHNNIIAQNQSYGIGMGGSGIFAVLDPRVVNNTIVANGGAALTHNMQFPILNNIAFQNDTGFHFTGADDTADEVANNLAVDNSSGNWVGYPSEFGNLTMVNRNNTPADAYMNIAVDPQFVAPVDYHLAMTSPLVGAGSSAGAPNGDFDGDLRFAPVDIGADEVSDKLSVELAPGVVKEGQSGAAMGTIGRNTVDTAAPLEVALSASNSDLIVVPAKVVIPAGKSSTTFAVEIGDNDRFDPTILVNISASALGYRTAATTLPVCDDEALQLGDGTGDGIVGRADIAWMLRSYGFGGGGSSLDNGDLNGDGSVGLPDLVRLHRNWGKSSEASAVAAAAALDASVPTISPRATRSFGSGERSSLITTKHSTQRATAIRTVADAHRADGAMSILYGGPQSNRISALFLRVQRRVRLTGGHGREELAACQPDVLVEDFGDPAPLLRLLELEDGLT